jgi:hypothetical protein
MPPLRWSILAADPGVVIAEIAGIAGDAREVTLVVAGTAEIQPDLGAGRNHSTTISAHRRYLTYSVQGADAVSSKPRL